MKELVLMYGEIKDLIHSVSLPCEETARKWPPSSQEPEHTDTLIAEVPASQTVRTKRLGFKPSRLCYFVIAA